MGLGLMKTSNPDSTKKVLGKHNSEKARGNGLPNNVINRYGRGLKKNRRKILFCILVSLPILLFFFQFLGSGSKILIGDFDYTSQMYEALRISVLRYHQFPLWNSWISGGVPLFANPQFGLFSIQTVFVLLFGAVYGLKLAYICYALAGFWGMYSLCKKIVGCSNTRSILLSYLWVFSGFFAGHNISHYTFSLFFILPWLIYFMYFRNWVWLGLTFSLIILSSIHYAFLMMFLVSVIFFLCSWAPQLKNRDHLKLKLKKDIFFVLKTMAVIIVLAGYRILTTYYFVAQNQRATSTLNEEPNSAVLLLKSMFFPIGTLLDYPKTHWGWGEYSMYIGIGVGLAILLILVSSLVLVFKGRKIGIRKAEFVLAILMVGVLAFTLALGDFNRFSPFNILTHLPGFSETRVPSRWLIFSLFSILVLIAAWAKNNKLINFLLLLSVLELFISFGPPRVSGNTEIPIPKAEFNDTFSQYDNGKNHLDAANNIIHSYYYTTSQNVGQIYADDSLVDTLDGVVNTSKCGYNKDKNCTFVLSKNARIVYWSPNKIVVDRTNPGPIELNMNVDAGWRINDTYPFAANKRLDPAIHFILPVNQSSYTLVYAPKFSMPWLTWRLNKI